MPIIPNIGRKTLKIRAVIYVVYALLIVGSITMIYPFLIMLSGSVKGTADMQDLDPFPRVLYSERIQFARFMEDRYDLALPETCSWELIRSTDITIPKIDYKEVDRYRRFLGEEGEKFPDYFYVIQESYTTGRMLQRNYRRFRDDLRRECGSIQVFNKRYGSALSTWNEFTGILDTLLTKEFTYGNSPLMDRYLKFKRSRSPDEKAPLNLDGRFFLLQKTFPEVKSGKMKRCPILAGTCPKGDDGVLWTEFVKHQLNCFFVKLDAEGLNLFRKYLVEKYPRGISQMNKINDTAYPSFESVNASYKELRNSAFFVLYTDFITNFCPASHLRVDTPSTRYREYVSSSTATLPLLAHDYLLLKKTKTPYMAEILTRNYRNVLQYIVVYGRAIFNTVVFIGLSILVALLVNPIAAYALSRFNLKSTYTILMFFIGTMAFPGAVTMIPNFLLLKQFHLLNTFWALILPGVANGFSIFILKGFFDSIPKEVYESALIDGAGEWTMFWRFTMALSTPILALITLGAFTAAYSAFMFALIICPDERMWTLMVWLYQMQQGAVQPVVYSALVLAAIPTLLVFIFAQNTIMKGIVIPVEK